MSFKSKAKALSLSVGAVALIIVTIVTFQNFKSIKSADDNALTTSSPENIKVVEALPLNLDTSSEGATYVRSRTVVNPFEVETQPEIAPGDDRKAAPVIPECVGTFGFQNQAAMMSAFSQKFSEALQKKPDIFLSHNCTSKDEDCLTYSYVYGKKIVDEDNKVNSCTETCEEQGFSNSLSQVSSELGNRCNLSSGQKLLTQNTTDFQSIDAHTCRCAVNIHFRKWL